MSFRTHYSYIVNFGKVEGLEKGVLRLKCGIELNVSRAKKEEFTEALFEYLRERNGWSDEFAKWCLVQECEENGEKVLKELSVEEIYNYYEQANIKEKEWIKQLVFEYQIVQDIGRNTRKIKVDKTVYILEKLGFKWAPVGKKIYVSL